MFFIILLFWLLPLTGNGPLWNMGMKMLVDTCKESESLLSSFLYLSNYRIRDNQNVFNFDQRFALVNLSKKNRCLIIVIDFSYN